MRLQGELDARRPGRFEVGLGLKHAEPTIEAGVAALAGRGVDEVVGLVLAPHWSALSVGQYLERAGAAAFAAGLPFRGVRSWHLEPAYLDFLAGAVTAELGRLPAGTTVVFSAHSLPERILGTGDPYPISSAETAAAVAARVGLGPDRWRVAWQSAGRTPEPWLGPDILTVIDELDGERGGRRAGVRLRLRRRSPRGPVRPRHRGPSAGRGGRLGLRPHRLRQRRPERGGRPGRPGPHARRTRNLSDGGRRAHVVVVGAGITGLAAAHALLTAAAPLVVTVLESAPTAGGKLQGGPFAGLPHVDAGADMFLARTPAAVELARAVGLGDELVAPEPVPPYVWSDGTLHRLPPGLVLGAPAALGPLARSDLLSWRGKARAALEPLVPRRDTDDNLGATVRARFGDEVLDRLVGPLVGGINAGDADHLSLSAVTPQLADALVDHRSLLLGLRSLSRPSAGEAVFLTPRSGVSALVPRLVQTIEDAGGTVCSAPRSRRSNRARAAPGR